MKKIITRYNPKFLSVFLFLIVLSGCSCKHTKKVILNNTEINLITSKENGVRYKLFVSLPEGYYLEGNYSYREKYPVVYLLDPDVEFALAENIARTLVNYGAIKPFIIVGIGYQDQDLSMMDPKTFWGKWTHNRARDYIPTGVLSGIGKFEGGDYDYKGLAQYTGGSEKFKEFIINELIPYVDNSYRVSRERALIGHSQAGLFTTWMMLKSTSVFDKYMILSPSLWVDNRSIIRQKHKINTLSKTTVYFAVGSLEYDSNGSMVQDLELLYSSLPKSKNINSKIEIIDDEDHVSIVPIALTKGFKFLFGV
jgi:predicted alpha/beta superfamily hydrolase